jgi:hypothetical protein
MGGPVAVGLSSAEAGRESLEADDLIANLVGVHDAQHFDVDGSAPHSEVAQHDLAGGSLAEHQLGLRLVHVHAEGAAVHSDVVTGLVHHVGEDVHAVAVLGVHIAGQ